MIIVLTNYAKMAPLVSAEKTTSLVPVHQNIRVHCVKHLIFVMVKTVQNVGLAKMKGMVICVFVTLGF